MAEHRAAKAGINAEAQARVDSKYDAALAGEVLQWIRTLTGEPANTSGDADNFYAVLRDGTLLCRLANALQPGLVKKVNQSAMAFKCMENINAFIDAARALGVAPHENFVTVDLWERQNLHAVLVCLQALGRKAGALGPREATRNVRDFSQEQLRAGQNVISLQYGTNKGQQSGISFGNQRKM